MTVPIEIDELANLARCFRCIPEGANSAVQLFESVSWANAGGGGGFTLTANKYEGPSTAFRAVGLDPFAGKAWRAVQFTAIGSYAVGKIELAVARFNNPPQTFDVRIFTDAGNIPGVQVGAASTAIAGATLSLVETWTEFLFPVLPAVINGTKYWVVWHASGLDGANCGEWFYGAAAGLDWLSDDGAIWVDSFGSDTLLYRIYSTP